MERKFLIKKPKGKNVPWKKNFNKETKGKMFDGRKHFNFNCLAFSYGFVWKKILQINMNGMNCEIKIKHTYGEIHS